MIQLSQEELLYSFRERNRDVLLQEFDEFNLVARRISEKTFLVIFRKKERDEYRNPLSRTILRLNYNGDFSPLIERVDKEMYSLEKENRVMKTLGYLDGKIPLLDYYRPMGDTCILLSRTMSEIQASKQREKLKRLSFNWKERSGASSEFPTMTGFDILKQSRYPKRKSLPLAAVDFERQCYEIDDLVNMTDLLKRAMVDIRVLKSV